MSTSSYKLSSDWGVGIAVLAAAALIALGDGRADARKAKADPEYAPTYSVPIGTHPANGAIFQADDGYAPLTSGARAARVGDMLTIVLAEKTQASKSNAAKTDRSGSIGLTPPATGPASFFKPTDIAASGTNTFDGKGQATQSNQLDGEISVTIAQIYPNGTMLVRGESSSRSIAVTNISGSRASSAMPTSPPTSCAINPRRQCQDHLFGQWRDRARKPAGLASAFLYHAQPILGLSHALPFSLLRCFVGQRSGLC